jgi:hypothetical protein
MHKGALLCLIFIACTDAVCSGQRPPQIALEVALSQAKDYVKRERIDVSSYYLNAIDRESTWLVLGSGKRVFFEYWIVWWVKPAVDLRSSVTIAVSMDGSKVWRADDTGRLASQDYLSSVPNITLEDALQLARSYMVKKQIAVSNFHLTKAVFVGTQKYWLTQWKHADGGSWSPHRNRCLSGRQSAADVFDMTRCITDDETNGLSGERQGSIRARQR